MAAKRSKNKVQSKPAAKTPAPPQADARLGQLQRLIELMEQKDVVELELEEPGARWRVRRKEPPATVAYATAAPMGLPMAAPLAAASSMGPGHAQSGAEAPAGEVFKSPMLGTFYRAASPEAEPFVKVGDRVSADSTLCIIEAMKVMNEIKAEREFEILEVLVRNGDAVEFGQPLFLIR